MKIIKTFERFINYINEKFDHEETYFKIMKIEDFNIVSKNGYLSPYGTIIFQEKKYKGNWTIPLSNIDEWLVPVKYFGSPLQALLMKSPGRTIVVLHLKIDKTNTLYNRDITKMFVKPSFKGYFGSFSDKNEYKINETFIGGKIPNFKLINKVTIPLEVSQFMAEPQSVLDFLNSGSEMKFSKKKMVPIKKAFMRVILKKILTLDFKNF